MKYNIKDLTLIRWSLYGKGIPQEWCDEVEKTGIKLVRWQGVPMCDCIMMLFATYGRELPPLPKGNLIDDDEKIIHKILDEDAIRTCYPEYVQN